MLLMYAFMSTLYCECVGSWVTVTLLTGYCDQFIWRVLFFGRYEEICVQIVLLLLQTLWQIWGPKWPQARTTLEKTLQPPPLLMALQHPQCCTLLYLMMEVLSMDLDVHVHVNGDCSCICVAFPDNCGQKFLPWHTTNPLHWWCCVTLCESTYWLRRKLFSEPAKLERQVKVP